MKGHFGGIELALTWKSCVSRQTVVVDKLPISMRMLDPQQCPAGSFASGCKEPGPKPKQSSASSWAARVVSTLSRATSPSRSCSWIWHRKPTIRVHEGIKPIVSYERKGQQGTKHSFRFQQCTDMLNGNDLSQIKDILVFPLNSSNASPARKLIAASPSAAPAPVPPQNTFPALCSHQTGQICLM